MNTIAKTLLFIFCAGATLVNVAQASLEDNLDRARRESQEANTLRQKTEETYGVYSILNTERLQHEEEVEDLNSRLNTCINELNSSKTSRNRVINIHQKEVETNGNTEAASDYQAQIEQDNKRISELETEIQKLQLQLRNKEHAIRYYQNQSQMSGSYEEESYTFYDYITWWPVTTSAATILTTAVTYILLKYLSRDTQLNNPVAGNNPNAANNPLVAAVVSGTFNVLADENLVDSAQHLKALMGYLLDNDSFADGFVGEFAE